MEAGVAMTKTTVYLDERELRALKDLAGKLRGMSAATLIREAVRDLLKKKRTAPSFRLLKKYLSKKPGASSFGEPIRYQRALRKDWN